MAIDNNIDLEGACGGTLACSTCHLYIDEASFDKLDEPDEEEEDMLDLAFGLEDNSRIFPTYDSPYDAVIYPHN